MECWVAGGGGLSEGSPDPWGVEGGEGWRLGDERAAEGGDRAAESGDERGGGQTAEPKVTIREGVQPSKRKGGYERSQSDLCEEQEQRREAREISEPAARVRFEASPPAYIITPPLLRGRERRSSESTNATQKKQRTER